MGPGKNTDNMLPWLEQATLREIATHGSRTGARPWLAGFWAWLHPRLPASETREFRQPRQDFPVVRFPQSSFPVVGAAAKSGEGKLGLLSFDDRSIKNFASRQDLPPGAQAAVEWLKESYKSLGATHQHLAACFVMDGEVEGESVGLAALAGALLSIHGIANPHIAVATGSFVLKARRGDSCLEPVSAATLDAKMRVALKFGYKVMLVVEGQKGTPQDSRLEFVEVPSDPALAIPRILSTIAPGAALESLAEALLVFEARAVKSDPSSKQVETVLNETQPFLDDSQPGLIRILAHEMRSSVLRHAGRTSEAEAESKVASKISLPWLPERGWAHDALRWHRYAHRAIEAIDSGRWEDHESEHMDVDRVLSKLNVRTRGEAFAELALRNARARRLDYLGRLRADTELIRQAIGDYLACQENWEDIWKYAQKHGRPYTTRERQHNQIIEALWALEHFEKAGADSLVADLELWPATISTVADVKSVFDLVAVLRYRQVVGEETTPDEIAVALKQTSPNRSGAARFPDHLVWEAILGMTEAPEAQRKEATKRLKKYCDLFPGDDLQGASIFRLLAPRAAALLRTVGEVAPALQAPTTRPLMTIFQMLRDSSDTEVLRRCPY